MDYLQKIVRLTDLPKFCGLKRTQILELIAKGEFPRPISLSDGGRSKGWLEHELLAWQQKRIDRRDEVAR